MVDDVEISVGAVAQLLQDQAIVLIDCREPAEWETARIDAAILMPMSRWQIEAARLKDMAGRRLVVHCHHGGRSLRVTNWLRENGFPNAQNMMGGIDAWSMEIDADVPRYDVPR